MTISIPDRLADMKLGQLTALADFMELYELGELDPEQQAQFFEAMSWITDTPVRFLIRLDDQQMSAVGKAIGDLYATALREYAEITSSETIDVIYCEEERVFEEEKGWFSWFKSRRSRKNTYYLNSPGASRMPAVIWQGILDRQVKQINANRSKPETWYKDWKIIPKVLASVAWRKDEEWIVTGHTGKDQLNNAAIREKEQLFLNLNASDAIKAFSFFLSSKKVISHAPNLQHFIVK